ncbi:DNA cytosine methyltransferase [Campylobacter sp. RM12654]|uniref:DNA cytosine methyltransferase n=1 Tax=Campylobacter sp. RM12654 TaxID=2735738 RepID=UPI003014FBEF|nr:DNA cytosine methyltransferase [Campylobacter sp. RM12654]
MFSSAGIGELDLEKLGIKVVLSNELLPKRAEFYKKVHPNSKMIVGDITNKKIFDEYVGSIPDDAKLLIATPPCQGMSNIGKNKTDFLRQNDSRNFLFLSVVDVIKIKDFDYILIENVPQFLKMKYFYDGKLLELTDYLSAMFSDKYDIKVNVFNAKYFGIPQSRPRAIVRMYKKHLAWNEPKEQREITLKEAIGHLPSLESGEISNLKHHKARVHKESHIECMRYTPTGKSAFENIVYFPKKENGERVKGFKSSYKRMKWEQPAPTITIRSDAISSQENVHPGRKQADGTYSDARVLTLRELFIVSSINPDWDYPEEYSDTFIRQIIGESVPPKLMYQVVKGIKS